MNLSKSYLYFQIAFWDTGANNLQDWIHADAMGLIRQMQLYTRSNQFVADIYEVQTYTSIVWKPSTKLQNYLTQDQAVNAGAGLTAFPNTVTNTGFARFFQPSHILLNNLSNHRHDNSNPQFAGYEPLHFYAANAVTNGAGQGSLFLNVEFPLYLLYDTIFGIDKDLFFNEVMVLRLVLNGTNRFAFTTPLAGGLLDPSGGAVWPATNAVAPVINCNIQNMTLYLAVEQNLAIENELRAKVHSPEGFRTLIPYIYTNKVGLPQSGSQSVSVRYNRGHGIRLKKVWYAPFNTTEQFNFSFDHSNLSNVSVAGNKITNFYTQMDNIRLQQYNVDCTNLSGQSQDWLEMQKFCKGSVIMTSNQYQYYWFWCDDFSNVKSAAQKDLGGISEDNQLQGLDLTNERKYDIILNTNTTGSAANGLNHYTFAITEKIMQITPNGILVS